MKASLLAKWQTFRSLTPSLKALIVLSFIVALGSYMVTPFIGVLMVEGVGLDIRVAGVLVAVATFIQFGGSILGGVVVDRLGLKETMVASLALRTAGLVLLGIAVRVPWVAYPAVVLVAAGPALYLPANKAYIITSVSDELRPLFLAVSSAALNAGMGLGPLLAALLMDADPAVLLVSAAVLFALITAAHQFTMKPVPGRPVVPGVPGPEPPRGGPAAADATHCAARCVRCCSPRSPSTSTSSSRASSACTRRPRRASTRWGGSCSPTAPWWCCSSPHWRTGSHGPRSVPCSSSPSR
ncbi:MFS transporter [Streptomyces lavendofoliae]|uniref:MFS transporter n=1 Tax=Streptomyces lavendofoliae TaxID=67314 RepID=UPI003D912D15